MLCSEMLGLKRVACAPEAPDKDLAVAVDCTRVAACRNLNDVLQLRDGQEHVQGLLMSHAELAT